MKKLTVMICCLMLLLCGCGEDAFVRTPMNANVSFTPTVYYGEDGAISFLYDKDRDMLSTSTGAGMSVVALYEGGDYSLVISYEETQKTRKEADEAVRAEFSVSGYMTLSEKTEKMEVSGHTFRRAEITADGGFGAVLYGNTANGYAQIYYIISSDAKEGTLSHVEEILSTLTFGVHEVESDDEVNIYLS